MDKIEEAKAFLKEIGMPEPQQNETAAYSLLTLAAIKPKDKWNTATNEWIRIHDVLHSANSSTEKCTRKTHGKQYEKTVCTSLEKQH